jgi:outer membrane protein
LPLPFFSYTGGRFFIRGLTGGVSLYKDTHHAFSLELSYLPQKFDASKSDDQAMRRLDDRDPTMLAGASYGLTTEFGMARLAVSTDILGKSNGIIADASYSYPFQLNILKITPAAGCTWTNSAYNDYYYGISANESRKSGLRQYDADSGFSPYAALNILVSITDSVTLMLHSRVAYLNDEVTNSPMVDQDYKYSFGAAVSYSF